MNNSTVNAELVIQNAQEQVAALSRENWVLQSMLEEANLHIAQLTQENEQLKNEKSSHKE